MMSCVACKLEGVGQGLQSLLGNKSGIGLDELLCSASLILYILLILLLLLFSLLLLSC